MYLLSHVYQFANVCFDVIDEDPSILYIISVFLGQPIALDQMAQHMIQEGCEKRLAFDCQEVFQEFADASQNVTSHEERYEHMQALLFELYLLVEKEKVKQ